MGSQRDYNPMFMTSDHIAKLLEPFLGGENHWRLKVQELLPLISMYIDILVHWNARINLTAIRDPEEIVTRHFGESFFAARHLFSDSAVPKTDDSLVRVADLGSGAGFPGIPIKLWAPHIALTLIESNQKKATFLREVARALTLKDVRIQNVRAETLPPASYDVVTLRAVERFSDVLPVVAHLLAPCGRVALLISSAQEDLARSGLPGVIWQPPLPVPASRSRVLLLGESEPH
jgi:16S rRNA (guanine527-N7)-methyltransferase